MHGFVPLRGHGKIHGLYQRVPPESDIGGVFALYDAGWSIEKIADEFSVSELRIIAIIKGADCNMVIKVKYLADIYQLTKLSVGDWIDLRCAKDIRLSIGDFCVIPLGVAMELPEGFEAIIAPRSSTFKRYGLLCVNSIGIIDHSYCGDNDQWFLPVYATRDTYIHKNDRICQFRIIQNMPTCEFKTVKTLGNDDRGGHGSTGID